MKKIVSIAVCMLMTTSIAFAEQAAQEVSSANANQHMQLSQEGPEGAGLSGQGKTSAGWSKDEKRNWRKTHHNRAKAHHKKEMNENEMNH